DQDIIEVALKKTNTRPDDALMVGDTRYDIEAAHRAGVQAIGLECGGHDADELHGALAVYVDPADLARHLDDI
ncbi:MAG: HAD family hydrolase, partial [Candidatus Eremiobacteraeota bacterium]|nr:HAD family hydrolase [Candidatus Eremiobacteraeota bacterium]